MDSSALVASNATDSHFAEHGWFDLRTFAAVSDHLAQFGLYLSAPNGSTTGADR